MQIQVDVQIPGVISPGREEDAQKAERQDYGGTKNSGSTGGHAARMTSQFERTRIVRHEPHVQLKPGRICVIPWLTNTYCTTVRHPEPSLRFPTRTPITYQVPKVMPVHRTCSRTLAFPGFRVVYVYLDLKETGFPKSWVRVSLFSSVLQV